MVRHLRGGRRARERGASAVEFALVMIPLLYLVLGAIQYGWYFYAMQTGTSATSDVVRRLSVGDCQNSGELKAMLINRLGKATTSSTSTIVANVTYTDSAAGHAVVGSPGKVGGGVTLDVTFTTADFNFPGIPLPSGGTVTRSIFARVEDTSASAGGCA